MTKILATLPELQDLARKFDSQGDVVNGVISTLDNGLTIGWEGNSATNFRNDWETEFKPALRALIDALNVGGQSLRNTASRFSQADGQA